MEESDGDGMSAKQFFAGMAEALSDKRHDDSVVEFDERIELHILASKLRLRVHIEILENRAQRDIMIQAHRARRSLHAGFYLARLLAALAAEADDINKTLLTPHELRQLEQCIDTMHATAYELAGSRADELYDNDEGLEEVRAMRRDAGCIALEFSL